MEYIDPWFLLHGLGAKEASQSRNSCLGLRRASFSFLQCHFLKNLWNPPKLDWTIGKTRQREDQGVPASSQCNLNKETGRKHRTQYPQSTWKPSQSHCLWNQHKRRKSDTVSKQLRENGCADTRPQIPKKTNASNEKVCFFEVLHYFKASTSHSFVTPGICF